MYAVVTTGGKQYRVEPGTTLSVERLVADAGGTITFDRVLLVGDGDAVTLGTPIIKGASVSGTVLGEELGPKLIIFKFKQKAKYRRSAGHRQHLTRVRIDEISAGGRRARIEETTEVTEATEVTEVSKAKKKSAAVADTSASAAPKRARAKASATTKQASTKPTTRRRKLAKRAESKE